MFTEIEVSGYDNIVSKKRRDSFFLRKVFDLVFFMRSFDIVGFGIFLLFVCSIRDLFCYCKRSDS